MGDPVSPSPGGPAEPAGGGFTGLWLREELPHGQVYGGRDHTGAEITLAILGAAAASDPRVREAFADAVWRHSVGARADRPTVHSADVHAPLPWAATTGGSGRAGAEQLLRQLPAAGPPDQPAGDPGSSAAPGVGAGIPSAPDPEPSGHRPVPGAPASYGHAGQLGLSAASAPAPRSGSRWPWLITAASSTMAVILLAVVSVTQLGGTGDDPGHRVGGQSPSPASPSLAPAGQVPSGEPTLRAVAPVGVLGPSFSPTENTFTMAFEGWPFAFRTPRLWACGGADWDDFPGGEVWTCERDGTGQLANVLLQECPTSCTEPERADMIDEWLDEPQRAVQPPELPATYYVENRSDSSGHYSVDLGHFTAGPAGGELRWLVGVYVESPPDTRDEVLKILNDVISQSS